VYTSIASIITPDYFKTCLYHDDPLSARPQPETSVGRRCHRAKVTVGACGHVSCRYSCFGVKSRKSRNYLRYFASFNLFAVNKDICILLSKLRGRLFTIFTAFSCPFWHVSVVSTIDRDRLPAWSCPLNRAVYIALHTTSVWSF